MSVRIVGREAELVVLHDFVGGIANGACALVLEGEAGMGKTTLWTAGIAMAEDCGARALRAQPVESETTLSFAGIGDLLDPVLEEALAPLPPAQRRALSRALVLDDDGGPASDPHAVGVAILNALRALSGEGPLLLAVDDVHWLDAASAGALAYAVRRLREEPVGLLAARRVGWASSLLDDVRRAMAAAIRGREVVVGPLDMAALHRVVQDRMGVTLPRPLLAEVQDASGGNPFYALEIVRMLERTGASAEAGQPLPVPESLHELVHERLLALPPGSRDFLLAAASYAHPTISLTEAASGVDPGAGLGPALESDIVELDDDRIRFRHPLLAAGAYEIADRSRRVVIHGRLAELLEDPEACAWQLAASVREPDEAVAVVLEEAARHARDRGALRPAALLLDRACELTPGQFSDHAHRRAVDAAFLHFESGDSYRAEAQLRAVLASLGPGEQRARALWTLARVRTYEAPDEAAELFLQVVGEAGENRELLAAAHEGVASSLYYAFKRLDDSARHADLALVLARELGDEALEGDILISKLGTEAWLGHPAAEVTAAEARELQEIAGGRRLLDQPLLAVAEYWLWTDSARRGRDALVDLLREADDIGDESSRPYLLYLLGQAESLLGNPNAALELGHKGHAAAEQSRESLFAAYNLALQSLAYAQLGSEAEAREAADRALQLVGGRIPFVRLVTSAALGHLELSVGASDRVVTCLEPALDLVRREAIAEPGAARFVVDEVEARLDLGRLDEAEELLDWYEGNARRLERASALANCGRCRGLLAAQAGDLDSALARFARALEWHAKAELPLDRGRTLLALGATQRRAKRRREARATLEEALALFERIGAALWAERTRAELRRISGRAPSPGALTPAEERVAALVAEGKTNREVASALYLSERTVEWHLSHVFGKLGITHRAELARRLQTPGDALSSTGDSPVSTDVVAP